MEASLILSICQIVAVAVIPLLVWWISRCHETTKAKRDAKRELFFSLMKNRKTYYASKEKVDALNMIDVVFQDDIKVRKSWKDYLESLNANSPNFQNNNSYLLDLLSDMAMSLGYKELRQTEIDRFYEPQVYYEDRNNHVRIQNELMRVLAASKSFSESRSEQDFDQEQIDQ